MAGFSGRDGTVIYDGATLCVTEWGISIEGDEVEVTDSCTEDYWKEFVNGRQGFTLSFTAHEEVLINGDTFTFAFATAGSITTATPTYTGIALTTGVDINVPITAADSVTWAVAARGTQSLETSTPS